MSNYYAYQSNSSYKPSVTMPSAASSRKTSMDFSAYSTNTLSEYKKQWGTNFPSSSPYSNEEGQLKQESFHSASNHGDYVNVKRLPQQFSSLRQTFDTRGNNRIREMISRQEGGSSGIEEEKMNFGSKNVLEVPRVQKVDHVFYSPKETTRQINGQLGQKIKKYSNTCEEINNHLQTTNKMSEQIKKLKEDRRKRLEAKEKEKEYSTSNSFSSSNLTSSSYTSPTSSYENKDRLREDSNGFKKKVSYESSYTPKYEKKSHQNFTEASEEIKKPNLDQYKQKKLAEELAYTAKDAKSPKFQKYEAKFSYSSKSVTPSSVSSKKIVESVKHVEINNFILGKSLGQGKFGIVYQAIHKPTGWLYAIKKVPKQMIKSHLMIDQFILELKLQTFLYHQNILTLFTHFDDKDSLYLVLEYMEEGTLFTHLKKNKTLPQDEVARKIREIASSIKYLHENEIAHRDIKPENIVMSHGVCKLCDFGWATICSDRRKTYCGTFDYAPPEILEGVEYDYTVDLWCLGILTYELLVGKAPFYHISRKETMKKILDADTKRIEYPQNISKTAINFIESLIKKDPKDRLSSEMLLEHPFLKNVDKALKN